jgi:hypothetical protein
MTLHRQINDTLNVRCRMFVHAQVLLHIYRVANLRLEEKKNIFKFSFGQLPKVDGNDWHSRMTVVDLPAESRLLVIIFCFTVRTLRVAVYLCHFGGQVR